LLLATDLSARCDRALDRAALLASEWNAQLTVVHALEPDIYAFSGESESVPSWRRDAILRRATAVKQIHQDLGSLDRDFDLIIEEGTASDVILQSVDDGRDLIVTGVARNETFGRTFFGGTVDRLARAAKAPVLVVKERARDPYKDIVVATDFSGESITAIGLTMDLFPDARVALLHCYQSVRSGMMTPSAGVEIGRQLATGEYADFINAHSQSEPRLARLPIFMEYGSVDSLIKAYAIDKKLDLVVLGSRGKNTISRMLLGSTAEATMASAPSDVLVVPVK
jgi:nucleotide-binding universal stress UspA family protein